MIDLPTIQSFRPITKAQGRGLPYEASPLCGSFFDGLERQRFAGKEIAQARYALGQKVASLSPGAVAGVEGGVRISVQRVGDLLKQRCGHLTA